MNVPPSFLSDEMGFPFFLSEEMTVLLLKMWSSFVSEDVGFVPSLVVPYFFSEEETDFNVAFTGLAGKRRKEVLKGYKLREDKKVHVLERKAARTKEEKRVREEREKHVILVVGWVPHLDQHMLGVLFPCSQKTVSLLFSPASLQFSFYVSCPSSSSYSSSSSCPKKGVSLCFPLEQGDRRLLLRWRRSELRS